MMHWTTNVLWFSYWMILLLIIYKKKSLLLLLIDKVIFWCNQGTVQIHVYVIKICTFLFSSALLQLPTTVYIFTINLYLMYRLYQKIWQGKLIYVNVLYVTSRSVKSYSVASRIITYLFSFSCICNTHHNIYIVK